MKLTRIEIKDVYNIKNANLDLSDGCALVVGPNGCGKTNIIKCIVQVLARAASEEGFMFQERLDKGAGHSFINLSFNFNESERKIFLQLRTIAIASKVIQLGELIMSQNSHNSSTYQQLEERFESECLPFLLKVFSSSCASFGRERNSADLTISEAEPPKEFRGIENCKKSTYVLNVELPDRTKDEGQIISAFIEKEFGKEILQTSLPVDPQYLCITQSTKQC